MTRVSTSAVVGTALILAMLSAWFLTRTTPTATPAPAEEEAEATPREARVAPRRKPSPEAAAAARQPFIDPPDLSGADPATPEHVAAVDEALDWTLARRQGFELVRTDCAAYPCIATVESRHLGAYELNNVLNDLVKQGFTPTVALTTATLTPDGAESVSWSFAMLDAVEGREDPYQPYDPWDEQGHPDTMGQRLFAMADLSQQVSLQYGDVTFEELEARDLSDRVQ